MNKIFNYIKTLLVAIINMSLLCGAGHVFDWISYLFKKSIKAVTKYIPAPVKRS